MLDTFNNLPPGFNAPYGPYTTGGVGNPANHGFAPKASPNTGNPMIDMIVPMAMQAFGMKVPEFSRPQTSDHAHTVMQERMRASKLMHPSIVASNPELRGMGSLGQNSLIQQAMDAVTSGGSRVDAFNTILGNFSSSLAGPGIKNMDKNAIGSANILKNFDVAFTNESGEFDFDKSSGYNRAETFKNVAAYDKQFGGFSGSYERKTDAQKNKEYLNIAKGVMDRPAIPNGIKGIDAAQKEIDQGRQKLRDVEQKMTKAETPDLSPSIDVLKSMLANEKDPVAREKIESVIDNATDIKNGRDENPIIKDVTEKIKESGQTNNNTDTEKDANRESTQGSASSVLDEITNKFKEFDKQNQTPDLSTVIAKIDATVSKFGNTEDKVNLEKAKQTQIENSASESEQVKNESLDLIEKFGNIQDLKKVTEIQQDKGNDLGILAEQKTEQNKEQQATQIQKIEQVNKMTRAGQNVFGQDMPLDEVMSNIKDLTEGMGDVETPDVTGLLQKIQATATVVDMSNDALLKYFDVVKNMYKGMGIKGPSSTEMAQNALLSAKATVDSRKAKAQKDGKMYTGSSVEEEAQKMAELQGGVVRSGANANVMGYLDTLSDEGAEGDLKKQMQDKLSEGDISGAGELARSAVESGLISRETQSRAIASGLLIADEGPSDELKARVEAGLTAEGKAALNGDLGVTRKQVKTNIATKLNDGETGRIAQDILGEGSDEKIKDFVMNDLRKEDLKDTKGLQGKLKEKFGLGDKDAERMAKSVEAGFDQNGFNRVQSAALTDPERDERESNLIKDRAEVQKEIENVENERSGQLRNLNLGTEVMGGIRTTFKELQKKAKDGTQIRAEDVAMAQGKDWDKMSENEKKSFTNAVDVTSAAVTGKENETTKKFKKIEEESYKKAEKVIDKKTRNYNYSEEEKHVMIEEEAKKIQKEETEKAGLDAKSLEKDDEEDNKNFDPKEAVDRISRLLEGIADKLGVNTMHSETYKNDTTANARTENNGGWWPF